MPMRTPREDEVSKALSHLLEVLDDLWTFWYNCRDRTVDDALLREFRWAVDEAYEELAQLFGNILGSGEDDSSDGDG